MKKFIFLFLTVFNILISFSQQKNGVSFFDTNANLTFKLNENFEFGNTNDEPDAFNARIENCLYCMHELGNFSHYKG